MNTTVRCNLCENEDTELYLNKDAIDVIRCRNCGLVFVANMPRQEDLVSHYSDEYFEPYLKYEKVHLNKRFKKRIEEIKSFLFPGVLLDIGCGAGSFLNLASQTGYSVKGVEISPFAAEYAKRNLRLSVFMGELGDADFTPESFDVITLWHILEHVRDPKVFLKQVNGLMKENGLMAVEVPNIGSPIARIAGTDWELMSPKEHFYFFNPSTIQRYLEESGFSVIRTQSFVWTTPSMLLRAASVKQRAPLRILFVLIAFLLVFFSFIRFRVLPPFFLGDVMTIYAIKKGRVRV